MSAIQAIYDAIAKWDLDTGVRNIDEVKNSVRAGDCPLRVLMPFTEGDQSFIALGTSVKVTWYIRDLMLLQPAEMGGGIEACAADLVTYMTAYTDAIRVGRSPTAKSVIVGATVKMGVFPWGTVDYWGVEFTLQIDEYLT